MTGSIKKLHNSWALFPSLIIVPSYGSYKTYWHFDHFLDWLSYMFCINKVFNIFFNFNFSFCLQNLGKIYSSSFCWKSRNTALLKQKLWFISLYTSTITSFVSKFSETRSKCEAKLQILIGHSFVRHTKVCFAFFGEIYSQNSSLHP